MLSSYGTSNQSSHNKEDPNTHCYQRSRSSYPWAAPMLPKHSCMGLDLWWNVVSFEAYNFLENFQIILHGIFYQPLLVKKTYDELMILKPLSQKFMMIWKMTIIGRSSIRYSEWYSAQMIAIRKRKKRLRDTLNIMVNSWNVQDKKIQTKVYFNW